MLEKEGGGRKKMEGREGGRKKTHFGTSSAPIHSAPHTVRVCLCDGWKLLEPWGKKKGKKEKRKKGVM